MDKEKAKIISMLKKYRQELSKKTDIDKLIFFGSWATGKARKNSDIDLLIVSKSFKSKKYFRRALQFYLMWDYPYDVDILCLTQDELEKKTKRNWHNPRSS